MPVHDAAKKSSHLLFVTFSETAGYSVRNVVHLFPVSIYLHVPNEI